VSTLALREWGADDASPLVFWPGLNVAAPYQLDELAPRLCALGYRVLAVDPPGWRSAALSRGEYRPSALARRLLETLDQTRFTFVGWSWGATIGVHLGALAPERIEALALLDAGYTDFQDEPDFEPPDYEELVAGYRDSGFDDWADALAHTPVREAFREEGGRVVPRVAPEAAAAALLGVIEEPPSEKLAALSAANVPVLLVVASATTERLGPRPLERFRARVPRGEIVTLESPHDVVRYAPVETFAALAAFLSATAASRRSPD
jgi:pimeloyl-ACP methyl ester carboxylesterase